MASLSAGPLLARTTLGLSGEKGVEFGRRRGIICGVHLPLAAIRYDEVLLATHLGQLLDERDVLAARATLETILAITLRGPKGN